MRDASGTSLAPRSCLSIHGEVARLIATYGAWVVGAAVGLESMGFPVPGETTLVTAALYAGSTGRLDIFAVVAAAAIGAVTGDNIGFWIGRNLGYRWLLGHGSILRITERRLKLGQYLFLRYGGKVVFFGRFVAVLRALAAFLAGTNRMRWRRFLVFNAAGGVVWATSYGSAAYVFGDRVAHALEPVVVVLAAAAVVFVIATLLLVWKYEEQLEDEAERALPGPLPDPRRRIRR
jgi:membrane protein DedA with SNARE-associated domain